MRNDSKATIILYRMTGALGFIAVLSLWGAVSYFGLGDPLWLAGPKETIEAINEAIFNQNEHIFSTFLLIIIATIFSAIIGIIFGTGIGMFPFIHHGFRPSVDFWRSIPPILAIPILYRWDPTGDDYFWRIVLTLFGCVPIMIAVISDAIENCNEKRLSAFEHLSPSVLFKFRYVIGYEILPVIFSGLRTIASFAIIIVIVSEMVLSPEHGIGRQIIHYQTAYEIQYVYAYAIIVGFIGLLINKLIRLIESSVIRWQYE